jgi:N-acyl-D-amino-acid deacylase
MLDILIKGGQVVDGSGALRSRADVAIEKDRIVEIGLLPEAQAATTVDATGCVVTPGFVDMHSHLDFNLILLPTADSLIYQGITTSVVGQCGNTLAPLLDETRGQVIAAFERRGRELPWDQWSTFESYLDYLKGMGFSMNLVPLVGQGTVRAAVMGFAAGPMSDAQMARAQAEVVKAMNAGAIGISTGLIYPPGSFAQTEELIEITRPVGQRNGYYFSHIRSEDDRLMQAVAEAIRIGREASAAVQISHFKASATKNWPLAAQALEMIDQARAEGLDVTADMYPYPAGYTGLVAILPEWAQEGGKPATLKRLADPDIRQQMIGSMQSTGFFRSATWDQIMISESHKQRAYEGRFISELADEAGKSGYDWIFDALLESDLAMAMIVFQVSEDNLRLQVRHPAMMIGTDADGRSTEGPLSKGVPHPRNYGTYPRVLGRFVREESVLSLEDAIWKMTGFPAQKLRWTDRGLVKKGYRADLVVLDPNTVIDRATFQAPHQYPVGIPQVIVNGEFVIRDGVHTGARPGKILGRS